MSAIAIYSSLSVLQQGSVITISSFNKRILIDLKKICKFSLQRINNPYATPPLDKTLESYNLILDNETYKVRITNEESISLEHIFRKCNNLE